MSICDSIMLHGTGMTTPHRIRRHDGRRTSRGNVTNDKEHQLSGDARIYAIRTSHYRREHCEIVEGVAACTLDAHGGVLAGPFERVGIARMSLHCGRVRAIHYTTIRRGGMLANGRVCPCRTCLRSQCAHGKLRCGPGLTASILHFADPRTCGRIASGH
eukprot:scaffold97860_cov33-Tisochrysis_lutea.AAC.2